MTTTLLSRPALRGALGTAAVAALLAGLHSVPTSAAAAASEDDDALHQPTLAPDSIIATPESGGPGATAVRSPGVANAAAAPLGCLRVRNGLAVGPGPAIPADTRRLGR